jgi:hypothetical protein
MVVEGDRDNEWTAFYGSYNFVDNNGKWLRNPKDDLPLAQDFSAGVARVHIAEDWMWVGVKGELISDHAGRRIRAAAGEYEPHQLQDRRFLYTGVDDETICEAPAGTDEARAFRNGLAAVRSGSTWGFIDTSGNQVIESKYWNCGDFSEDRAAVLTGDNWTYIDRTGTQRAWGNYDEAEPYRDGLARVTKSGKQKYLDLNGHPVLT